MAEGPVRQRAPSRATRRPADLVWLGLLSGVSAGIMIALVWLIFF